LRRITNICLAELEADTKPNLDLLRAQRMYRAARLRGAHQPAFHPMAIFLFQKFFERTRQD
jgi:hypothetical protein